MNFEPIDQALQTIGKVTDKEKKVIIFRHFCRSSVALDNSGCASPEQDRDDRIKRGRKASNV